MRQKSDGNNDSCSSMTVCLMFARKHFHRDFSDILNLCEGCYNPLDKEEIKNVCRGANFI